MDGNINSLLNPHCEKVPPYHHLLSLRPIYFNVEGNEIDPVMARQLKKAPTSISVTPSGIINEPVKFWHSPKAAMPILVSLSGKTKRFKVFFPYIARHVTTQHPYRKHLVNKV
nr:hypothetical protein [uncultured Prevotella sp.]